MIFTCYFNAFRECRNGLYSKAEHRGLNDWQLLRDRLSTTTDSFVFIITKSQWDQFQSFVEKYKLNDYLHFNMGKFVSNYRYPADGPKLRLVIFKGKKHEN